MLCHYPEWSPEQEQAPYCVGGVEAGEAGEISRRQSHEDEDASGFDEADQV